MKERALRRLKYDWDKKRWLTALCALLLSVTRAAGQNYMPTEETRLLHVRFSRGAVSLDVSEETDRRTSAQGAEVFEQSRFEMATRLQLSLNGYVYHPKLLQFSLAAEEGRISEDTSQEGQASISRATDSDIQSQSYNVGVHILSGKPYAIVLGAHQVVVRRQYDFFTRATVEGTGYNIGTGYMAGRIPFHISFSRRREDVRDGAWPGYRIDSVLSLTADNSRSANSHTKLRYRRNHFEVEEVDRDIREGFTESLTLSDVEKFREGRSILRSRINYHRIGNGSYDRKRVTIREALRSSHAYNLQSAFAYRYHGVSSGGARSGTHDVAATVFHNLYASLRSSVHAEAGFRSLSELTSSSGTAKYGLKWGENYSKRLSTWGRLKLDASAGVSGGRHDAPADGSFAGEQSITLKDSDIVFLAEPNIDRNSIVVSDPSGVIAYTETLDYMVVQQGVSTELRRVPGGTIPDGATVIVEYNAEHQPSDTFSATTRMLASRLDLHEQRVGLYARYYNSRNSGFTSLIREEVTERSVGADVTFDHVHAAAGYKEYDSNISPYRATRLTQGLSVAVAGAPLTLDLQQSWIEYLNTGEKREQYSCVGRYGRRIYSSLVWRAEGGVHLERGEGVDIRRKVARSGLSFRMGKLATNVGYQFHETDNHGELSQKHSISARITRNF